MKERWRNAYGRRLHVINAWGSFASIGVILVFAAQVFVLTNRFKNREQFLAENLKAVPHSNLLHRLLAQELAASKKYDQAFELLEKARRENPYDILVQVQIAELKHVVERQKQTRLPAQDTSE